MWTPSHKDIVGNAACETPTSVTVQLITETKIHDTTYEIQQNIK